MSAALSIGTAASGAQVPTALYIGTAASGNQAVQNGYVGTQASGNQLFYAALKASVAPAALTASSSAAGSQTTGAATVTPAGGSGSYSYAWTQLSGDPISITTPAAQSTTFSGVVNGLNTGLFASFSCLVTDTSTGAQTSVGIEVSIIYTGPKA